MKMKLLDYTNLRIAVLELGESINLKTVREHYNRVGKGGMRFRWDVLHATRFQTAPLYAYLNDAHIDTALRSILDGVAPNRDEFGSANS